MKTVFLHGLGQTAQDWKEVAQQLSIKSVNLSCKKYSKINCLTGKRSLSLSSQHPTVLREMDEV